MFSDDIILEIISDIIMLGFTVAFILYIIWKDDRKIDLMNERYDSLIHNMVDKIIEQQTKYKNEFTADIRELNISTLKVLTGLEKVVSGVKDVQTETTKVTEQIKLSTESDQINNLSLELTRIRTLLEENLEDLKVNSHKSNQQNGELIK